MAATIKPDDVKWFCLVIGIIYVCDCLLYFLKPIWYTAQQLLPKGYPESATAHLATTMRWASLFMVLTGGYLFALYDYCDGKAAVAPQFFLAPMLGGFVPFAIHVIIFVLKIGSGAQAWWALEWEKKQAGNWFFWGLMCFTGILVFALSIDSDLMDQDVSNLFQDAQDLMPGDGPAVEFKVVKWFALLQGIAMVLTAFGNIVVPLKHASLWFGPVPEEAKGIFTFFNQVFFITFPLFLAAYALLMFHMGGLPYQFMIVLGFCNILFGVVFILNVLGLDTILEKGNGWKDTNPGKITKFYVMQQIPVCFLCGVLFLLAADDRFD